MDGVSAAASILAIGTAGVQISVQLITFASQVSTASDRIPSIGSDVSLTANVLQQLSDLMDKNDSNKVITIFSEEGLSTTRASADACKHCFQELEDILKRASEQIRAKGSNAALGKQIVLSKFETLKWPFLQSRVDTLRTMLNNARETLMLILQVTTLGYMKKLAEMNNPAAPSLVEQWQQKSAILALAHSEATSTLMKNQKPSTQASSLDSTTKDCQISRDLPSPDFKSRHIQSCTTENSPPMDYTTTRGNWQASKKTSKSALLLWTDRSATGLLSAASGLAQLLNSANKTNRDPGSVSPSGSTLMNDHHISKLRQPADTGFEESISVESWLIEPVFSEALYDHGYNLRWVRHPLPLEPDHAHGQLRMLFRQSEEDSVEQFTRLTPTERNVIRHHLHLEAAAYTGTLTIKSLRIKKKRPVREPITLMPWRCIYVLVARTGAVLGDHSPVTRWLDERWRDPYTAPTERQIRAALLLHKRPLTGAYGVQYYRDRYALLDPDDVTRHFEDSIPCVAHDQKPFMGVRRGQHYRKFYAHKLSDDENGIVDDCTPSIHRRSEDGRRSSDPSSGSLESSSSDSHHTDHGWRRRLKKLRLSPWPRVGKNIEIEQHNHKHPKGPRRERRHFFEDHVLTRTSGERQPIYSHPEIEFFSRTPHRPLPGAQAAQREQAEARAQLQTLDGPAQVDSRPGKNRLHALTALHHLGTEPSACSEGSPMETRRLRHSSTSHALGSRSSRSEDRSAVAVEVKEASEIEGAVLEYADYSFEDVEDDRKNRDQNIASQKIVDDLLAKYTTVYG